MLTDRIFALREANIYERQRYRHILGMPLIQGEADGVVSVGTSFLVIRTMREGQMDVFVAGVYKDKVRRRLHEMARAMGARDQATSDASRSVGSAATAVASQSSKWADTSRVRGSMKPRMLW